MAGWTVKRKVGCHQFQELRQLLPPLFEVPPLLLDASVELGFCTLSDGIVNMYDYLVQDLSKPAHPHKA